MSIMKDETKAAPVPRDYRTINGWGVDLDPALRPNYPKELPSDVTTIRGPVGARQTPPHRIHKSVEHPDLTPVFGTSCPPHGLSGMIRDFAFKYSEGKNAHWMILLLADRVDVVESMVGDALRGRPDHFIAEKGWKANFKYDDARKKRTKEILAGAAIGLVAAVILASLRGND
jgi:hypothetical protein